MSDESPQGGAPRPLLSITEAAEACGVNRYTIRNRLRDGQFPGAAKDGGGHWAIPVADLLGAGLRLHAPQVGAVPQGGAPPLPDGPLAARVRALEAELARVNGELTGYRKAAELAELALRALPAGEPARRRRWWRSD